MKSKFCLILSALILGLSAMPAVAKGIIVVVNRGASSVTIIDAEKMTALATIPTGTGPHEVVLTADGKTAIVSIYGEQTPGNSLSIIDIAAKKETKRIDLGPMLRPHGLVEIGGKVYFSSEGNRAIGRLDLATQKVDWIMGTGQNASHMVVLSSDQRRFYTSNVASDTVTAFEFVAVPPSQSKITQIAVGKQPEAIDVSPDGKQVWVGLNVDGAVDVIDTAANKVVERVNLGGRPYRVRFVPDGRTVVATMTGSKELVLIDTATRKETKRIKLEGAPLGIAFSTDGKTAFVTTTQDDFLNRVDLEKGEVTARTATGKVPDGVAVHGL